ncbi:MAG: outer membrane lipoprotein carrier protein LolA [Myxococcota bacterium]
MSAFFPAFAALVLTGAPEPSAAPKPAPSAKAKPAAPAKGAKPAAESPEDALVGKVQAFYDQTKDFSGDFIQLYTRVALSKTSESHGTMKMLKPGMMRWDYDKPDPKHFIADGKQLYVYDPEDQHVSIDPQFQLSDQGSSLSFLWGQGRLKNEFKVKLLPKKDGMPEGTELLELVPKKDATYTRLELTVDTATGQVNESTLFETTGNTNRFRFSNVKTNLGLKPEAFQFTPPPGAEVAVIRR